MIKSQFSSFQNNYEIIASVLQYVLKAFKFLTDQDINSQKVC